MQRKGGPRRRLSEEILVDRTRGSLTPDPWSPELCTGFTASRNPNCDPSRVSARQLSDDLFYIEVILVSGRAGERRLQ